MKAGRGWPLERLEREIGELAAHINAATCRWLELVAEYDRREGWAEWGARSCAQWLAHQCALAPSAAREHVRVARRLLELPLIRAAFGCGELSYSKVRALSRVATAELEEGLLEIARYSTAAQLERTLRAYRGVVERELSPADLEHGERYLVCEHDDDGSLLLRARLPAEEGALLLAALEAARDGLRAEAQPERRPASEDEGASAEARAPSRDAGGASAEADASLGKADASLGEADASLGETASPSNADALLLMAEALLASGPVDRSGADSYQVVVHVDAAALSAASEASEAEAEGTCQLDDGSLLHPETARRLACDASVVRILERDGRPLSVGRRTRSIPPALRRALQSRDGCCRFPGCTQRRFLHAHHIEHWAHGGSTELTNLVHLCTYHHRLVHEGGYTLERAGRRGVLRFRRPDGRPLAPLPEPQTGHWTELERRNRRHALLIDADTCASRWAGEPLDLPLVVDGLVAQDVRLN